MVISWAPGKQYSVDLLVEPQRGLTREMLYHAKKGNATNLLVMFSGPHGISVDMDKYESILMVASGFGIATHLPYLKTLIHGYNARLVRTRRIHLVWQIRNKGKLLNTCIVQTKTDPLSRRSSRPVTFE